MACVTAICWLQAFTVESKKAATFSVLFSPDEVGSFSHELQLRVRQNPFEQHRVAITGACSEGRCDMMCCGVSQPSS